jgi:DNA-binding XRE family transcriptional regulator
MFIDARKKAGLSRDEAAFRIHIGSRTLLNYEHEMTIPPPDVALKMAEVYDDPSLTADYCSNIAQLGRSMHIQWIARDSVLQCSD